MELWFAAGSIENPNRMFFECHSSIIQREKPQRWPHSTQISHVPHMHSTQRNRQSSNFKWMCVCVCGVNNVAVAIASFVFHFRLQLFDFVSKTYMTNQFYCRRWDEVGRDETETEGEGESKAEVA